MTDSISIYEKYNIDLNRLSRDYLKFPLKRSGESKTSNLVEYPTKEDLKYLYNELFLTTAEISKIFNCSSTIIQQFMKLFNLTKTKRQLALESNIRKTKNNPNWKAEVSKKILSSKERNNPNWKEDMVQRHKQTMTEKYGRDNYFKGEEGKKAVQDACMKKLGRTNYFKGEEGKKAVQDACMKKYGVDHPMQVKEIKQNAINTYKLKTGYDNPSQNPEVKKKKEETSLKNFGVTHAMKLDKYKLIFAEMRGALHVNDLNELFFRNNFVKNNRFLVDKCSEYFNIHNERILFYKKKFNIKEQNLYKTLKTQQLFFDHLNNLNIIYDYRVKYKNKKFRPDGYDPETNTIYEFLGDYWHGNSKIFNLNEMNTSCYKTFKQLNEETFKRFDEIRSLGYKIIYIWESDFIKNNKIKENWRSKMVEY